MRKQLTFLLLATTSVCGAQEENSHKHFFSPKAFYRAHTEKNYQYKTSGLGVEYRFYKTKGLNIKLSGLTNFKYNNVLVETDTTLFFCFPINEYHTLYPILSMRHSSHKIEKVHERCVFINLSTGFVGLGCGRQVSPVFQFRVEGFLFRDLRNALVVTQNSHFWGHSYSNPTGARLKVGLTAQCKEEFFLDIDGHYGRTFEKCYKECGTEISFKWGF